eukprot:IDg14328t1
MLDFSAHVAAVASQSALILVTEGKASGQKADFLICCSSRL